MSLVIIKKGLLDTIQDLGRFGYQHLGINPNGAMDLIAAKVANILVGNSTDEAVIELHFPASTIKFTKSCLIAIAGADFGATIDNHQVPINCALIVSEGSVLAFAQYRQGARCYLAVEDGFYIKRWLNSNSTNLKAVAGGFEGRSLKMGDVIEIKTPGKKLKSLSHITVITSVSIDTSLIYRFAKTIRIVSGSGYHKLTLAAKNLVEASSFQITVQSDRMGYRLSGHTLGMEKLKSILSSAVIRGTIQLLPSGQLIVLMADHQTTGGYPKVGNVITADLPTLAQMRPNQQIKFKVVTLEEAQLAYVQQEEYLQQLEHNIKSQINEFFKKNDNRSEL